METKNPGRKKRKQRQARRKVYQKLREELQVSGDIPTVPEGAIRNERVDPATQDEQRFPGLDRLAIQNDGKGWAVPEHVKRKVVEKAAEVLFEVKRSFDKDGNEIILPPDRYAEAQAAKTLMTADKFQHEVDNPEAAGKAAGATQVAVVDWGAMLKRPQEPCGVEAQIKLIETKQGGSDEQAAAQDDTGTEDSRPVQTPGSAERQDQGEGQAQVPADEDLK